MLLFTFMFTFYTKFRKITAFRMCDEKIVLRRLFASLHHCWKKGLRAKTAVEQFCEAEGEGVVYRNTAAIWFKHFNKGDTNLEDKARSGRPSEADNDTVCYKPRNNFKKDYIYCIKIGLYSLLLLLRTQDDVVCLAEFRGGAALLFQVVELWTLTSTLNNWALCIKFCALAV